MSNLKRYSISIALAVLAIILFIVGALALTIWKPSQEIVAVGQTEKPYITTRTGVLPLYDEEVTVTVTASDPNTQVWLAVGNGTDVSAWLDGKSFDEVVGLKDLSTLKFSQKTSDEIQSKDSAQSGETPSSEPTVSEESSQSGETIVNPIASDMWFQTFDGKGTLTAVLSGQDLNGSLLVATDGESPAPTVSLTWPTPQTNYLAWISFIFGGGLLFTAALIALVLLRVQARRTKTAKNIQAAEEADSTDTTMMKLLDNKQTSDTEDNSASEESSNDEDKELSSSDTAVGVSSNESTDVDSLGEDVPVEKKHSVSIAGKANSRRANQGSKPDTAAQNSPATTASGAKSVAISSPGRKEKVSTESGMINMAALRGGAAFPTRRALHEAEQRGVDSLVVEGKEFSTGSIPVVKSDTKEPEEDLTKRQQATSEILGKRSSRRTKWNSVQGLKRFAGSKNDNENDQHQGADDE